MEMEDLNQDPILRLHIRFFLYLCDSVVLVLLKFTGTQRKYVGNTV